jgi:hypothetical protein
MIRCSTRARAIIIVTVRSHLNEIWRFRFTLKINDQKLKEGSEGHDSNSQEKSLSWTSSSPASPANDRPGGSGERSYKSPKQAKRYTNRLDFHRGSLKNEIRSQKQME